MKSGVSRGLRRLANDTPAMVVNDYEDEVDNCTQSVHTKPSRRFSRSMVPGGREVTPPLEAADNKKAWQVGPDVIERQQLTRQTIGSLEPLRKAQRDFNAPSELRMRS